MSLTTHFITLLSKILLDLPIKFHVRYAINGLTRHFAIDDRKKTWEGCLLTISGIKISKNFFLLLLFQALSIGYFKSSFILEIIWVCSCFSDPFLSISNGLTFCLKAPLPLKKVTFIHYLQSQFWGFRDDCVLLTRKMSQQHRQEFRYLNACVNALWWLLLFYTDRGKEQKETRGMGEGATGLSV